MLKLYYITQWDNNEKGLFPGPAKKINSQIRAFESYGYAVKLINNRLNNTETVPSIGRKIITGIYTRLPFTGCLKTRNYEIVGVPDISLVTDADVIYIRFWWGDYQFAKMIRKLRRQNPHAIIFLEFPDYPYRSKETGFSNLHLMLKDLNCCKIYRRKIDYIVTLTYDSTIFGVPSIHMYNGIDVNMITPRKSMLYSDSINLGFVASAQYSHGIDRVIQGMNLYYSNNATEKRKIFLHVAGGGPVYNQLQNMCNQYKLGDYVSFYGYLYENELDDFYDNIDIGIDYLAPHRDGISISSSLKTREYMAKGIPIITAAFLDICEDKKADFYYKIEASDEPLNINNVISFVDKLYSKGRTNVISDIRRFAEENIDIRVTMNFINNYITRNI